MQKNKIEIFNKIIADLKPSENGEYRGSCPYHKEETPGAFCVNGNTGQFICHSCGIEGNMKKFIQDFRLNERILNDSLKTCTRSLQNNWDKFELNDVWKKSIVAELGVGQDGKEIVFGHHDRDGKIVAVQRHKGAIQGINQKSKKSKWYLAHKIKDFNKDKSLYISEGLKDAVTLACIGLPVTSTTTGARHFPAIKPINGFHEYIIVYDNDEPGRQGSEKLAQAIISENPNSIVKVAQWDKKLPQGYDVTDDAIATHLKEFDAAIRKAVIARPLNTVPLEFESPESPESPDFQCRLDYNRLTPQLTKIIKELNGVTDAPDEFLLSSILAIWAGIVGKNIVGPSDLRPNINTIIFARTTRLRKSSSISIPKKIFEKLQDQLEKIYLAERKKYEQDYEKWLKEETKKSKPKEPVRHTLFLPSDFSEAGFIHLMKDNRLAGVIITEEYSDYWKKLNRDTTNMGDAMLAAYDNGQMGRLTIKRGFEAVNDPAFSLLGATTLEGFKRTFTATEQENGALQRILPVVLSSPTKKRIPFLDRKDITKSLFNDIYNKGLPWLPKSEPGAWSTPKLKFNSNLQTKFKEWESRFICEAEKHGIDGLEGCAERMIAGAIKLAMLAESLESKSGGSNTFISSEALDCATMLIENIYFPSMLHLWKYEIRTNPDEVLENQILDVIQLNNGQISRTQLRNKIRKKPHTLDRIIGNLAQQKRIYISKNLRKRGQGGGNAETIYTTKPPTTTSRNSGKSGDSGKNDPSDHEL